PRERRKLKENRPELSAEGRGHIEEAGHILLRSDQSLLMRDPLRRFQNERERIRDLLRPLRQHLLLGHAIERVVDLYGVEAAGVELQHFVRRKIFRIKASLPLLVTVAAGANANPHGVTIVAAM